MPFEPVTDPDLLAQLNAPEPEEVTDPDLLAQLNAPEEVTDPDILAQLNAPDEPQQPGPTVSSDVGGTDAATPATDETPPLVYDKEIEDWKKRNADWASLEPEQAQAVKARQLTDNARRTVAGFIGSGTQAAKLAGVQPGVYEGAKGAVNDFRDVNAGVAEMLRVSGGDIDRAIDIAKRTEQGFTNARTLVFPEQGRMPRQDATGGQAVKYAGVVEQLSKMRGELDKLGIPAEKRGDYIRDTARITGWTENDDDLVRQLSDGEVAINPGRVFGRRDDMVRDINAKAGSPEAAARGVERLDAMRQSMAPKLMQATGRSDGDFAEYANKRLAEGVQDKAAILDEWSKQQEDRNWVFKSGDAVAQGIETGAYGVVKTAVGGVAGAAALVGADDTAGTLGGWQEDIGTIIREEKGASELRGIKGGYAVAEDLTNTVTQMAPMFAGGIAAQGLKGMSQAVVGGMSVYGWAGAQGYESKLSDALDMAVRANGGKPLTNDQIAGVLGSGKVQLAAFANATQTALLARVLGGGVERAALGKAAASMTVRDFVAGGGLKALRDGTLRGEIKAMGRTIFKDAADETLEEGLNQLLDKAISAGVLGEQVKLGDLIEEVFKAGALGGVVGGAIPQVVRTTPATQDARELIENAAPAAPEAAAAAAAVVKEAETVGDEDQTGPEWVSRQRLFEAAQQRLLELKMISKERVMSPDEIKEVAFLERNVSDKTEDTFDAGFVARGYGARVKSETPGKVDAPPEDTSLQPTPLSRETIAGIRSGVASLDPDMRELWANLLERKLAKKGTLTWEDIPQDLGAAMDTVAFGALKDALATNPTEAIGIIAGKQNAPVEQPAAPVEQTPGAEAPVQETAPDPVEYDAAAAAPAATEDNVDPAKSTPAEFNDETYEMAKDLAEFRRSSGNPDLKLEARLASHEARLRGEMASTGEVFAEIVQGNPLGDEVMDNRLTGMVPIKVRSVESAQRKLDYAQKQRQEIQQKLGLWKYQFGRAKTKTEKNKLEKQYPKDQRTKDETFVSILLDEVEPALQKLYKQASELGLPATDSEAYSNQKDTPAPPQQVSAPAEEPTASLPDGQDGGGTTPPPSQPADAPQPYSQQSLKDTFNLTDEEAAATDALVKAMGLDTSRLALKRGGTPGEGAMAQGDQRFRDIAPEGVIYRADETNPKGPKLGAFFFSGDRAYLDNYMSGDRSLVVSKIPSKVLDIRDANDRKVMVKWLRGEADRLAGSDNIRTYRAAEDIRKALARDDSVAGINQAFAISDIARGEEAGVGIYPGLAYRAFLESAGYDAMTVVESVTGTRNTAADFSFAILNPEPVRDDVAARDEAHRVAVERGDMETAQRLVDEAAKAAGYTIGPVYHGTKGKKKGVFPFTVFDTSRSGDMTSQVGMQPGAYFAENRKYAEGAATYASNMGRDGKPVIGRFYLRSDVQRSPGVETAVEYVATSPEQIKSADPATYDANGNLIPLSQRFNQESPSILYQGPPIGALDGETDYRGGTMLPMSDGWVGVEYGGAYDAFDNLADAKKWLDEQADNQQAAETEYAEAKELAQALKSRTVEPLSPQEAARMDAEYFAADARGDEETMRRILREAAFRNGYTIEGYHGTDAPPFETFIPRFAPGWGTGVYFADNVEATDEFGDRKIHAYLRLTNPLTNAALPIIRRTAMATDAVKALNRRNYEGRITENELEEELESDGGLVGSIIRELGYDGVISKGSNSIQGLEIVVFESRNIKSADLRTRDSNGEIIPPSRRFDTGSKSILYQDQSHQSQTEEAFNNEVGKYVTGEWEGLSAEERFQSLQRFATEWISKLGFKPAEGSTDNGRGGSTSQWSARFLGEYVRLDAEHLLRGGFQGSPTDSRAGIGKMGQIGITEMSELDAKKQLASDIQNAITRENPNLLLQYAGEKANMPQFMRDSLDTAKAMAAQGKSSEEIRAITGWFPNPYDGKLRWEIPDNEATANPLVGVVGTNGIQTLREGKDVGTTLGEIINHPALFDAYPDMANIAVTLSGTMQGGRRASYVPASDSIRLSIDQQDAGFLSDEHMDSILHEIQHAVQEREGFAKGSSPQAFASTNLQLLVNKKKLADHYHKAAVFVQTNGPLTTELVSNMPPSAQDEAMAAYDSKEDRWLTADELLARERAVREEMDSVDFDGTESYKRTAGEYEARDTATRRNLTPEQRKAVAPYSSENLSPEAAIVMFQNPRPQSGPKGRPMKGSFEILEDGRILLRGLTNPDVSTAVHELAHVARRVLLDRATRPDDITEAEIDMAEQWAGARNGIWTVAAEEKWARGFERYLREGVAPTQWLAPLFDKIGAWLRNIYQTVQGSPIDVELTPEIRALFDKLVSRGEHHAVENTEPEPLIPEIQPIPGITEPLPPAPPEPPRPQSAPLDLPPGVTGVMHAITDEDRRRWGLPERIIAARLSDEESWDAAINAERQWKRDGKPGTAGSALIDNLLTEPHTPSKNEFHLLAHEKLMRELELESSQNALNNLPADAPFEVRETKKREADAAMERFKQVLDILDIVKREAGRSLQSLKIFLNPDFSIAAVARQILADKNRFATTPQTLTPEDMAKAAEWSEKLKAAEERLDLLTGENASLAALVDQLTADIERAQARSNARSAKVKPAIKRALDPKVAEARKRLEERGVKFLAQSDETPAKPTPDAAMIRDMAIVAAGWLVDKAISKTEFVKKLTATFGAWVSDVADTVFRNAKQVYHETVESVDGRTAPSPRDLADAMDKTEPEPDSRDVWAIARAFVIQGVRGMDVITETFNLLAPHFPELTRERVAEVFTGYGKVTYPSKEEVPRQLEKAKEMERIALKIADVKAGRPPKRTGPQRGDRDVEVREMEKEFRKLLKESGIETTDPERQLKSSLDAAKRRMQNEIEEIERAIATRVPRRKDAGRPLEYDAEAVALKSRLEQARNDYESVFGTPGRSEADRAAALVKLLDRQIAEEGRMLRDGVLKKAKASPVAETPEIAERRRILSDMRRQRRDLWEAAHPGETALEQAKRDARRSLEALQRVLDGTAPARTPTAVTPDAELQALWDAREALRDEVAEMRRAMPLSPAKEARMIDNALRQSQATLQRLEDKLAAGDLSVAPKRESPASRDPRVAAVRDTIKLLNKELARRRREAVPKMDPALAREKRLLASIAKRKAELERRMKDEDYAPKPKTAPLNTAAVRRAQADYRKTQSDFLEARAKYQYKNAPLRKKALHAVVTVTLLHRLIKLSLDFGVGLRQNLDPTLRSIASDLMLLARMTAPVKRMRENARRQWKSEGAIMGRVMRVTLAAFANKGDAEHRIYNDQINRPNSVWDKVVNLKVVPPYDETLLQQEDLPRSNIIEKIPWWVWPGIAGIKWAIIGMNPPAGAALVAVGMLTKPLITALERAQRAYTNEMRTYWFDRMIDTLHGGGPVTVAEAKAVADFVMVTTGRGTIKKMDSAVPVSNMMFLAVRYNIAQIQLLLMPFRLGIQSFDKDLTPEVKKQLWGHYSQSVVLRGLLLGGLAALFGKADDDDPDKRGLVINPFDPSFGKLRTSRNTSINVFGSILQYASLFARIRYNKKVSFNEKTRRVEEETLGASRLTGIGQEVWNFLGNKRNVTLALMWDTHSGYYHGDKPANFNNFLREATESIIINDTKRVFEELGPVKGAEFWTAMFFGIGTGVQQTEAEREKLKLERSLAEKEMRRQDKIRNNRR